MRSRLPCPASPIGFAATCALACAVSLVVPAGPAGAQAGGRMAVSGYVSPRCWIVPPGGAVLASERLPSGTLAGSVQVRCSDPAMRVQVQRTEALLMVSERSSVAAAGNEATTPAMMTVTISPRS